MALLALGTWWLVQQHAAASSRRGAAAPPRHEPDYMMTRLRRSSASPPTARCARSSRATRCATIPTPTRSRSTTRASASIAADGRVTLATARRALANGDGSEVQLLGGAVVRAKPATAGRPAARDSAASSCMPSCDTERVRSHLPVRADARRRPSSRADAHGVRQPVAACCEFNGRVRAHARAAHARSRRAMSGGTAGLHHRRIERHRPGAGAALPRRRLAAGAGRAARRRDRAPGPQAQGIDAARCRRLRAPTCATSPASSPPAAPASPRQGAARRGDRQRRHQRRHRHRRCARTSR